MIKEFLIFLRIIWATDRELYLKNKLAKHRCKMVDIHEKYKDYEFKMPETRYQFEYLHSGIMSRWYGDKKEEA
uniref:hypothetical protein n=1 Tax=Clostridium sp. 12(A) TaxID=1163671 RepID=UPI00046792B2|nr:hypothetical protein [Clostridium sp. 12(A)]